MGAAHPIARRSLTVEEYHRIGEAGVFAADERIELIDGEMISMAPIGAGHVGKLIRLTRLLVQQAGALAAVSPQNPIALAPDSEPQPDIVLLKPRADDYASELPRAQDVLLIIEIADTTLSYDRDVKLGLYARHGIAEVWLVDLRGQSVTLHREPTTGGYRQVLVALPSETISPALIPSIKIRVADLW